MMAEPDKLISTDELEAYAAGDFAWAIWRSRGVIYEDVLAGLGSDLVRRRAIVDARVELISPGDFLRELERARLIQSSDQILDKAAAAGRNVDRQRPHGTKADSSGALRRHLGEAGKPDSD